MAVQTILRNTAEESSAYSARAERALRLYEERGDEIRRIGPETFEVPSCSGRGVYTVKYGGQHEHCSCPDRHTPCKHLLSVGVMHAARRSGIRVRIISAAGDPFKAAAKGRAKCDGCGRRDPLRDLIELDEDNHDGLTYFSGQLLCRECADDAGIL